MVPCQPGSLLMDTPFPLDELAAEDGHDTPDPSPPYRKAPKGYNAMSSSSSIVSVSAAGLGHGSFGGPLRNLGKFVYPTLPASFGRDSLSCWSLLSGVCARGSKRSHTGGKCVICLGLHNSEINHSCVSPRKGCLE